MITGTKFKVGDFALVFLRRDYSCVEIIGIIEETTRTKDTITYVVKHKEGGAEEMLDSHYVFSKTEIKCMTQRIINILNNNNEKKNRNGKKEIQKQSNKHETYSKY